jgi:hypothetical protein
MGRSQPTLGKGVMAGLSRPSQVFFAEPPEDVDDRNECGNDV